jgi:hypothetical protein
MADTSKLPSLGSGDHARFTFTLWEGLNGKYNFYVQRWRRTIEYLRDQHWETLKQYDVEYLPDWRKFPLQNYTLAFYNDYLTDYLKSEVRYSATPATADAKAIDSAELSELILKYVWDLTEMDSKRIDLSAWIIATGNAHLRVYWDTDTGNTIPIGIPTPQGGFIPIDPDTMQPTDAPVEVDMGEIACEVVSPQFVRWAENPAHGVMVGLLLSYEEAVAYYGEDVADRLSYTDSHEGISADLNQIQQPGITPIVDQRTLVIEHYLPKSATNPDGLWWTSAAGGSILIHEPWPLPAGRIPVISFRWIPLPGERYIGTSPLYSITFQNKVYEQITARILEWYDKAKPKRLLKAGGGITHGDITDEPYQELIVNAGGEPEMLDVDDAPAGLFRLLGQVQGDMQVTSGRSFEEADQIPEGLSRGSFRVPSEWKSSRSVTTGHITSRASWREVGEVLLHYVGTFYNERRVLTVVGPDRSFLWREFSGADIMQDGHLSALVRVDDIPLVPQNRQNLRDSTIALLQSPAGQMMFQDPTGAMDMDRIKAAMQAIGLDENLAYSDPDELEARNEEQMFQNLQQGMQPPKPESWQNHAVHYASHILVPKSRKFAAWPPEAQQAFLQHIQETGEILSEQAQEEADAMVEQEQKLRAVREQEELKADVMRKWAESLIDLVAETTGLEVEQVLSIAQGNSNNNDNDD